MRKGAFIPELQSMRGVAALLVAFFHAWASNILLAGSAKPISLATPYVEPNPFWRAVQLLNQYTIAGHASPINPAVLFFFVLSGFVLAGSLQRDGSFLRFAISRVFRIYPAVFASIGCFCIVFFVFGAALNPNAYDPVSLIKNLTLVQSSINGVLWAVQTEMLAAPVIFLGYLCYRYLGIWALAAMIVVGMYFSPWDPLRWLMLEVGGQRRVGWMWIFLLGMFFFHTGKVANRLNETQALLISIAALIAFFFCTVVLSVGSPYRQMVEALSSGVLISVIAYGPSTAIKRWLNGPLPTFYGEISYSFYLLHPLTLIVIWNQPALFGAIVDAGVPRIVLSLSLGILSTVAITPLAWLCYRYVELNGIRAGKRVYSALRPPPIKTEAIV